MKKLIICTLSFFISLSCWSQGEGSISGRMVDKGTETPIPYVTITLKNLPDSSSITGAFSNEEGRFAILGLSPGNYVLSFSFVGYQSMDLPILIGELNSIYNIGKIELEAQPQQLEEVVVEGERATVSSDLDRKSFDVLDNISQSGGSVLDAMKNLPGVTIDQEGKVLIRGSNNVVVLINGKQNGMTGFGSQKSLDNIPAANIERIDIINNPSSKYDAAGMAGIINIIYKKENEKGWTGDVGLTFGLGDISIRKPDLPTELGAYHANPKMIPSLNLNYRAPRLNFMLQSEVIIQEKLPNNEFTTRDYFDGASTISQVPENRKQTHYIFRSGVDWKLNERSTLGFSTIVDYESHIDTSQIPYIDQITNKRYRYWNWKEDEVTGFLNFRLNYEYQFKEIGRELQTSLQYTRGWENEQYFLNDSSSIRQADDRTHIIATENTTTFNADYVQPLFSGRLELGTRLQFRTIPVTYEIGQGDQSIIYPGLGEFSDWGENIYAAYLNYVHERPSLDIEAGLRIEQTDVFYDIDPVNIYYDQNDAYDYFRFFPNIRLTFKINPENNLSLFFNNRVDRPGEPNLRVFPKYDDPELLKVGNPYVRPQFTQTYEAAYKRIWTRGSVFLAAYYRNISDPFIRIYSVDASNQQYNIINKIYQNVGSGSNLGMEVLLTQAIRDNWKTSFSFNWYNNEIDAYTGTLLFPYVREFQIENTSDLTWDAKLNNQWDLGKTAQVQLTAIYLAPKNTPQGRQLSRASVDIGIKKSMLNNRAELIFSATDIFNTFELREEIRGADFNALYENYYETQVFRVGFNYKFK